MVPRGCRHLQVLPLLHERVDELLALGAEQRTRVRYMSRRGTSNMPSILESPTPASSWLRRPPPPPCGRGSPCESSSPRVDQCDGVGTATRPGAHRASRVASVRYYWKGLLNPARERCINHRASRSWISRTVLRFLSLRRTDTCHMPLLVCLFSATPCCLASPLHPLPPLAPSSPVSCRTLTCVLLPVPCVLL